MTRSKPHSGAFLCAALIAFSSFGFSEPAARFEAMVTGFFQLPPSVESGDCEQVASHLEKWLRDQRPAVGSSLHDLVQSIDQAASAQAIDVWRRQMLRKVDTLRRDSVLAQCAVYHHRSQLAIRTLIRTAILPVVEYIAPQSGLERRSADLQFAGVCVHTLRFYLLAYAALLQAYEGDCEAMSEAVAHWFDEHFMALSTQSHDLQRELAVMSADERRAFGSELVWIKALATKPADACVLKLAASEANASLKIPRDYIQAKVIEPLLVSP